MPNMIPKDLIKISSTPEEYVIMRDYEERRLYLSREISPIGFEDAPNDYLSSIGQMVKFIIDCNREDRGIEPKDRQPIKIYINSPGGDIGEGFALISAIELSKTPIYTINIGQWSSMSFYIGIAGHKRFSLPYMTFLLHDGSSGAFGSSNKVQDRVKFDERFENEVVKRHVLKHGKMSEREYDAQVRVEFYMLPEDALELGFIDQIVSDIDDIL